MSPEFDLKQPGDDHIKRQKMLNALGDAIASEDFDFMVTIAEGQDFLRPFELAEYLNVKRENCEEPEDQENWKQGLERYLETLEGQEFPEEEKEVIDQVVFSLQADNMSETEAPEPEILEEADEAEYPDFEIEQDVENWDEEQFHPLIEEDEVEEANRLSQGDVFKQAVRYAEGIQTGHRDPQKARELILANSANGNSQKLLLRLLDTYIAKIAERYITGLQTGHRDPEKADLVISTFSSDEVAAVYVRSAIDKHVYDLAERYIKGIQTGHQNPQKAKEIIENFASTEERCDAMLRRLGFA